MSASSNRKSKDEDDDFTTDFKVDVLKIILEINSKIHIRNVLIFY